MGPKYVVPGTRDTRQKAQVLVAWLQAMCKEDNARWAKIVGGHGA